METPAGRVETVLGPLRADDLGPTLLHEHVICDMRTLMGSPRDKGSMPQEVTLQTAAEVRWDPFGLPDNYLLDDQELAAQELRRFQRLGGKTVVDCTPSRYRNPEALRSVAEQSGVNIVMGGGHYLEKSHPTDLLKQSVEEIAHEFVREARDGVGETGIRPGIIGEIGTGDPVTDSEVYVLRAMAMAQIETGLCLTVHVHPWGKQGHRVLDVLLEMGVAPDRIVLNHSFVDIDDPEYVEALLARGATLGYDMFGFDHSLFRVGRYPPSDFDVANEIARLVQAGYLSQLIISQDICVKTRMIAFGGWGYGHILAHVVPMLRQLGLTDDDLTQMLENNPRGLLVVR